MKKRALGGKKKYIAIIVSLVAVLALGAGGYWYYVQQKDSTEQVQRPQATKKIEEIGFRGDRDVATDFIEKMEANKPDEAAKVYENAVAAADSTNEKMALYNQHIVLAYQYKMYEQALKAALAADELQSSYLTLAAVADVYGVQKNSQKQIEYLTKALEAVDQLPQSENTDNMKQLYQSQLNDAKKGI